MTTESTAVFSRAKTDWQVLIVDADLRAAEQSKVVLEGDGYQVRCSADAGNAIREMRTKPADLLMLSLGSESLDGIQLLARAKELFPDTTVVVVTTSEGVEGALEALRRGAADFLTRPFDASELRRMTRSCLKGLNAKREEAFLNRSTAVTELSRMLSDGTDPRLIPVRGLEIALTCFDADSAALLISDPVRGYTVAAQAGNGLTAWENPEKLLSEGEETFCSGKLRLGADERTGDCYAYSPLKIGEYISAVLCLRRPGGPWFGEKSAELIQMYCGHFSVALETARMRETAAGQVAELNELLQDCRMLSLAPDTDRLAGRLLDGAGRIQGAQISAVIFRDGGLPRLFTSPAIDAESDIGRALQTRMLGLLDPAQARRPDRDFPALANFISSRIRNDREDLGVVAVFTSRTGGFAADEAHRLSALAGSASVAASNSEAIGHVSMLYHETIEMLGNMVDARCPHGDGHSKQVRTYAGQLARQIGIEGRDLFRIEDGALLHDIGKLCVPEMLLRKPDELTAEEFRQVAAHAELGARMVQSAKHLSDLAPIIRHHHERYDGTGYPGRLKGNAIPLGARITALADAFDAMVSHRAYRPAISTDEARKLLAEGMNSHFDPELTRIFLGMPLEDMIEH